ncbi:uncharacterized protein J8A68_003189 [[Candida] subhashii]|uniref:Uncharacterized protein n=1 Tax=[Candida] subhashii TaxID=561895 RepID=A0A8J5UWU9_9ASCO|nr:uncharacterized protein J8A68_003189 [[Candida] subhashii]KAG7663275.1 hypothetical protein J8A68_003189 [[Candida] subhashii]
MFRITPVRILTRSFSSAARRQASHDIGNGMHGQKTWPSMNVLIKNYRHEAYLAIQWAVAFTSIMLAPYYIIIKGSKFLHNVPKDTGAQVEIHGLVNRQTEVHLAGNGARPA